MHAPARNVPMTKKCRPAVHNAVSNTKRKQMSMRPTTEQAGIPESGPAKGKQEDEF